MTEEKLSDRRFGAAKKAPIALPGIVEILLEPKCDASEV